MAVLNQMFQERELAAINPAVRERIEGFTLAGAKIAKSLDRSAKTVQQMPELEKLKTQLMRDSGKGK